MNILQKKCSDTQPVFASDFFFTKYKINLQKCFPIFKSWGNLLLNKFSEVKIFSISLDAHNLLTSRYVKGEHFCKKVDYKLKFKRQKIPLDALNTKFFVIFGLKSGKCDSLIKQL